MSSEAILFTDGSCALDGSSSGAGYLARCGDRMLLGYKPFAGIARTSDQAEVYALGEGVVRTIEAMPSVTRIVALLDNEQVVRAFKGWSRFRGRAALALQALQVIVQREGIDLDVRWTRGHSDEGKPEGFANAVVDRLAKTAMVERSGDRWEMGYDEARWSSQVAGAHRVLRSQPRYVGHATAAEWIGVSPDDIPSLHRHDGLTAVDRNLVSMTSVNRLRRVGFAQGLEMPNMSTWSPGPLDVPPPYVAPIVGVSIVSRNGQAAIGSAARMGNDILMEGFGFGDEGGRLIAELDGVRYALNRLADRIPPVAEVRVQVPSEGVRALIDRSAEPGDSGTKAALERLLAAVRGFRARIAVESPSGDPEATALARIANHLAFQALEGTNLEGDAYASSGWHENPHFYGDLGMDPPAAHIAAWAEEDAASAEPAPVAFAL